MKKFLSLLLGAAIFCTMSITAFAAEITIDSEQTSDTVVEYGVEASYVVSIPDRVLIGEDYTGSGTITVSDVLIPYGSTLVVSLNSDSFVADEDAWWSGHYTLTNAADANDTLDYTIHVGEEIVANDLAVVSIESGELPDGEAQVVLDFALMEEPTKAGQYNDTLTFSVGMSSGK